MTTMCVYGSVIVGMLIGALFMAIVNGRLMRAMLKSYNALTDSIAEIMAAKDKEIARLEDKIASLESIFD